MKLFEMAKKFGDGFKEGWNGCQSDGKTEWQDDSFTSEQEQGTVHNDFFVSEDVSPNDTSHPYHDYYYGKK